MLIGRPTDISDAVSVAAFFMFVMAVLTGARAARRQRLQARDEGDAVRGELVRSEQFGPAARDTVLLFVRLCRARAWPAALCRRAKKWPKQAHHQPGCPCARRHYRSVQDASTWWRRRTESESGTARAPPRNPVVISSDVVDMVVCRPV